jgi:hypothetical protein
MRVPDRKEAARPGTCHAGQKRLVYLLIFSADRWPETYFSPLFLAANLGSQSATALGTAAREYGPSAFCRHPMAEAVVVDHFPVGWLICSFHFLNSISYRSNFRAYKYNKSSRSVKPNLTDFPDQSPCQIV